MSSKNQDSLSSFMKKRIENKNIAKKPANKSKNISNNSSKSKSKDKNEEELSEEEQLEEARKLSKSKAKNMDQTRMIKKLIMENTVKYLVIISILVIFALGIIQLGPAILKFFNGLIYKMLMGAIK